MNTFCILSDQDDVNVFVSGLDAGLGFAVQHVDEQVEGVSQLDVSRFQI
jgi:hypothetical protein